MRAPWATPTSNVPAELLDSGPVGAAAMPAMRAPWAAPVAPNVPTKPLIASPSDKRIPWRRINSQEDLQVFIRSKICEQFMSFASELSDAVTGVACTPDQR